MQHISDGYTPSQILHGFLFCGLLWLIARRLFFGWRVASPRRARRRGRSSRTLTASWNATGRSPYRSTASLDYYDDSVLNSVADIGAMILGFLLASRLPGWSTVTRIVLVEGLTMGLIRYGLALNILTLNYPVEAIATWQAGR